jgi:hypothetical protein
MKSKALEIRDKGTFIPALAVDMNPVSVDSYGSANASDAQRYLLRRCGYPCDGRPNVVLTRLDGNGQATNDPYAWGGRTWPNAHNWIIDHWENLNDGDVVDVEFILGETQTPKQSERFTVFEPKESAA